MSAMIGYWKGQPIEELTREQLLEIVLVIGEDLKEAYENGRRWQAAADPLKYLAQRADSRL